MRDIHEVIFYGCMGFTDGVKASPQQRGTGLARQGRRPPRSCDRWDKMTDRLATALVEALDDHALDRLAARLAGRLTRAEPAADDRWLSAREAASYLGVSLNALHKLSAARALPFEQDRPGCKLWFRRSELDRWRTGGRRERRADASTALPHQRGAAS